ncbi:MAG: hypothetical protein ACUZ8E_17340 [Candidatus Anammoxibacter sp.]
MTSRTEILDLKSLLKKADDFTLEIFDWVLMLEHQEILGQMYTFKDKIKDKIKALENETD